MNFWQSYELNKYTFISIYTVDAFLENSVDIEKMQKTLKHKIFRVYM